MVATIATEHNQRHAEQGCSVAVAALGQVPICLQENNRLNPDQSIPEHDATSGQVQKSQMKSTNQIKAKQSEDDHTKQKDTKQSKAAE
eukprot:scaffold647887_cov42-Prasinocladus_malaysianus.AAC.2